MEMVKKMDSLAKEWESRMDNRGIFLSCYCIMTKNMFTALDEQRFKDEAWVSKLLHRFAAYYFDALACFDCGEAVPPVWRYAHDAAAKGELHVLQHLFLGVNAHINYDLVLTLHEILHPEWDSLSDLAKERRYQDHMLVNTIIGETIDQVQDEVVEQHAPKMDLVDKLLGRLDEKLITGLISKWRKSVWKHSLLLLQAQDKQEIQAHIQEIEQDVLRKAQWIVRW